MQNVIAVTILFFRRIMHALFDTDDSHLFISVAYVKLFEHTLRVIEKLMYVAIPVGQSLIID